MAILTPTTQKVSRALALRWEPADTLPVAGTSTIVAYHHAVRAWFEITITHDDSTRELVYVTSLNYRNDSGRLVSDMARYNTLNAAFAAVGGVLELLLTYSHS